MTNKAFLQLKFDPHPQLPGHDIKRAALLVSALFDINSPGAGFFDSEVE